MVAPPKEHKISISPKIDANLKEIYDISNFIPSDNARETEREHR